MGLPLNLPLETVALLAKAADALEQSALGPERQNSIATINVVLGDAVPIDEPEPATPMYDAALSDDATGDTTEDDRRAHFWRNPPPKLTN